MNQRYHKLMDIPRIWHVLAVSVLVLVGFLIYGHTLKAPFYLDDIANIRDNLPQLRSFSISDAIETAFGGRIRWRPLSNLSFALNAYVHGLEVPGFHVVNITIHIINGLLLYWFIFKTLTLPAKEHRHAAPLALAASLLWFCHPLQIQSVTYIVQRMASMAAIFSLISLLAYIHGRLTPSTSVRYVLFFGAFISWILAVASKENALPMPLLVFVYEWFFFQNLDKGWFLRWIGLGVAVVLGLFWLAYGLYGYSPLTFFTAIEQPRGFTAIQRLLTESRVVFLYMGLLAFPHPSRLTLNHDLLVSRNLIDPITTLFSCFGLLAIACLTILSAKRYRLHTFCIIWFFGNLSLECLAASIELMFEHRVYLPSMLIFLPVLLIAADALKKPAVLVPILAVWLSLLSFWTYERNDQWNDPVRFWEDATVKSPLHFRVHFQLGTSYMEAGHYDKALHSLEKALSFDPPYPTEIYTNIGIAHYRKGNKALARQNIERAISLNAMNYIAHDLAGTLYRDEGNYDGAIQRYQKALAINPNFMQAAQNLGLVYVNLGKIGEATHTFEDMIARRPSSSEGYGGLGLIWATKGSYDLAIAMFLKAIEKNPRDRDAIFNLAITYAETEQYEKAAKTYQTALRFNPADVEAMHNLGILFLKHLHDVHRAMGYFQMALATNPDYDQAAVAKQILGETLKSHSERS